MSDSAPLLGPAGRPPQHLRIVLLGPSGAGKTRIFRSRLPATTTAAAAADPAATTQPDFCVCTTPLHGRAQRLQLWDTPGASRAASLPLLKGAHAAALVCSVLTPQGPAALAQWLPAAATANALHNSVPAALVVVAHGAAAAASSSARDEARALAAAHGLPYLELDSASDCEGLFAALGEAALRTHAQARALQAPQEPPASSSGSCACCPGCRTQ